MTFRNVPLGKTWNPAIRTAWRALVLLNVFVSAHADASSATSWREVALDSASVSVENGHGSLLPAVDGVMATLDDLSQCRVGKEAGVHGVIAMSDAGLAGPFIAVWWDSDGKLSATVRSVASVPEESFTLRDGGQTELILVRRGVRIYAYAADSGRMDPLIAVDFASGSTLNVGALIGKDFNGQTPAISPVVYAPAVTGDVLKNQPGAGLTGNWSLEEESGSLGGSHLVNRGDDVDASAAVTLENLQPGTHELWIHYAAAQSRSEEVEVTVEGFGKSVSLAMNQRISGGIWLALGQFDTDSATSATIGLKPCRPGSGSLSMDGVHAVWAEWKDEDKNQMPDVLEATSELVSRAKDSGLGHGKEGFPISEEFRNNTIEQFKPEVGTTDAGKAVIFVNETLGNDAYDGRSGKPQTGAWYSVRGGPKRTIGAALKSVPGSPKIVEIHLEGRLDPPVGGFQDLGNFNIVLVPAEKGVVLESPVSPSSLPILSPPRMTDHQ